MISAVYQVVDSRLVRAPASPSRVTTATGACERPHIGRPVRIIAAQTSVGVGPSVASPTSVVGLAVPRLTALGCSSPAQVDEAVTPAMEAGLTDHVWAIRELLTVELDDKKAA